MDYKEALLTFSRYVILALLSIYNLKLFYIIFEPATINSVLLIMQNHYKNVHLLAGNIIFFDGLYAQIIPACVAGAAYYLLFILNLSTPMEIKKRIYSLLFITITFLLLNIFRIVIFTKLIKNGYQFFDLAHELTWYLGSTILVILVWFVNVKLFNIKAIPIYTDATRLFSDAVPESRESKPKIKVANWRYQVRP